MSPLLLSVALLCTAQAPEPAAMVLTSAGAPTLERAKDPARRAGAMTLLFPGDRLQLPDGAEVTAVFLADGHRERVTGKLAASVEAKGFAPADKAERLPSAKVAPAGLESLRELAKSARGGVGVLRGDDRRGTPPVIAPMDGAAILTDRPTLTWPAAKDADAYLVQFLSGAEGREQRRLWQATTKETRLAFPEKEKPLTLGLRYHWKVIPLKGEERGEPVVFSKFSVLTKSELKVLEGVKPLEASEDPADQLLAASLYHAHGVFDEALRLYERLAAKAPHEAEFQAALASYYARAGRADLADKARGLARKLGAGAPGEQ